MRFFVGFTFDRANGVGVPARAPPRPKRAISALAAYTSCMCRNIRVLYHFDPPTTADEIDAAALQYVRKVTGLPRPSEVDAPAFERAVGEVAAATARVLGALRARTAVRTREGEREKARRRGARRAARDAPR